LPVYKCRCKEINCQAEFEAFVRNSKSKIECPICKSENVEKLPTKFNFIGKKTKGKLNK